MKEILLTHDMRDVLVEMHFEHKHPTKPKELIRPRDLSGPMGKEQSKALYALRKEGLAVWTNGSRVNRFQCRMWSLTELGIKAAKAIGRKEGPGAISAEDGKLSYLAILDVLPIRRTRRKR